jgi:hypothetical protein
MGIVLKDSTRIVDCTVNITAITHYECDPDNDKITNIYLTSGNVIRTPMTSDDFMLNLIKLAASTRYEDDEYDGLPKTDDNEQH